jgi:hypothetical protein
VHRPFAALPSSGLKRSPRLVSLSVTYWATWRESKEKSEGNPAFLLGVQWCIKQRCQIYGFTAPGMSRAQLEALDELVEREFERIQAKKEFVH